MAASRKISLPWTTVYAQTTAGAFVPESQWMPAHKVAKLRADMEVRHRQGSLSIQPAYQTGNVENNPDTHNTFGVAVTADGVQYAAAYTDVSANTGNKKLVRFGYEVKNTEGATLNLARVEGAFYTQEP